MAEEKTRAELLRDRVAELLVDEPECLMLIVTREGAKLHGAMWTREFPLDDFRGAVGHLKTNCKRSVLAKIRAGDISEVRGRDLLREIELGDGRKGGKEECHDAHMGDEQDSLPDASDRGGGRQGADGGGGLEPALPSGA